MRLSRKQRKPKAKVLTTLDKSDYYLELSAWEKMEYASEIHKINLELGEHLASSLQYMIHYCKKHDIPLPNLDMIQGIIDKVRSIEGSQPILGFSDYQPRVNTDNDQSNSYQCLI